MTKEIKGWAQVALLLWAATLAYAFEVGGEAFTKKKTTALLAAPQRDAATVGTLPWGSRVNVVQVQGLWLQITGNGNKGWVFGGNLSQDKPPADNKNDFLPTAAGDTTAATAARPLAQAAIDYADRKDEASSAQDVQWLEKAADAVRAADVDTYLQQNNKGDFIP